MTTEIDVLKHVTKFFEAYCGDDKTQGLNQEQKDDVCLLRIACMGNPEKTIQGELFKNLRDCPDIYPILEYRFHRFSDNLNEDDNSVNRSIDIMVFDRSHVPIAAIEIKHHSPNHGTINSLIKGLNDDSSKADWIEVPLIQVGLYTQIERITENTPIEKFIRYRFITSYVFGKNGNSKINLDKMKIKMEAARIGIKKWATEMKIQNPVFGFSGRLEVFSILQDGPEVTGRVNYFAGLASRA